MTGRSGTGLPEAIWRRLEQAGEAEAARLRAEQEEAVTLAGELIVLPEEVRLETVEREERFWTLGLAGLLLQMAKEALPADTTRALAAGELARAAAIRLSPARYPEGVRAELEASVWVLLAEARRLRGDLAAAEQAVREAERHLRDEPLDSPARAPLCRALGLLRQAEGRVEEALALLGRAIHLHERAGERAEAAEVRVELGWLCLEEGDAAAALPALQEAVGLLDPARGPALATRAGHGLALAYAELGSRLEAEKLLAATRELRAWLPDAREELRFTWREARIAESCGRGEVAAEALGRVVPGLIAEEELHEAAVAALELAGLYVSQGRTAELEALQETVAPLIEQGALPLPARTVFLFALRFTRRGDRDPSELLAEAAEHLERARRNPALRFRPQGEVHAELPWDQLDRDFRQRLCQEAGVPSAVSGLAAAELDEFLRDLIAWTFEEVARVRVVFEP